jgi:hypothetical protein
MKNTPAPVDPIEHERWLDGIVSLAEGAALRGGCSPETLIKLHRHGALTLIRRTERLWGIRRRDALALSERSAARPAPPVAGRHPREIVAELIRAGHLVRLPGGLIVESEKIGELAPTG